MEYQVLGCRSLVTSCVICTISTNQCEKKNHVPQISTFHPGLQNKILSSVNTRLSDGCILCKAILNFNLMRLDVTYFSKLLSSARCVDKDLVGACSIFKINILLDLFQENILLDSVY